MTHPKMTIAAIAFRESGERDNDAIYAVEERAFQSAAEAQLAVTLIAEPVATISLVADADGEIVGHVLLTEIGGPDGALALAPLAVDPDWRDMQVGTELVRHALAIARKNGWKSVFVLGAPDYYRRFGFKPELADCAEIAWQGPEFMALELADGALAGWSGPLTYPAAFFQA